MKVFDQFSDGLTLAVSSKETAELDSVIKVCITVVLLA